MCIYKVFYNKFCIFPIFLVIKFLIVALKSDAVVTGSVNF